MAPIWFWYGKIYGPYMYGFHMVLIWDTTHHIEPICCQILPLYCLFYGKDTYFVKIHTFAIHGNDMGNGNGMGWLLCKGMIWEWYGSLNQFHIKLTSMGKIRISLKSILFPYLGMIWAVGMVWDDCYVKEYGDDMGAYISSIPNPHLWERYRHVDIS